MSGSKSSSSKSISLVSDNNGLNTLSQTDSKILKKIIMLGHLDILFHRWKAEQRKYMYKTTGWPLIWLHTVLHHLIMYSLNPFFMTYTARNKTRMLQQALFRQIGFLCRKHTTKSVTQVLHGILILSMSWDSTEHCISQANSKQYKLLERKHYLGIKDGGKIIIWDCGIMFSITTKTNKQTNKQTNKHPRPNKTNENKDNT